MCLDAPPQIYSCGHGVHGQRPVERFHFTDLWCLHLYRYAFTLEIDGRVHTMRPGMLSLIPPRARMIYRYPRAGCRHDYAIFSLADGPASGASALVRDVEPLGAGFPALLERVADFGRTQPARAAAALWEALWRLVGLPAQVPRASPGQPGDDLAERVAGWINARLAQPLRVAHLAEEAELSHNALTRRFQQRFGTTVIGYIQQQRLAHAKRLLAETTMPIKTIALECGYPDPQQFNKAIRHATGMSPSALRRG